jgi:hypothetical protein
MAAEYAMAMSAATTNAPAHINPALSPGFEKLRSAVATVPMRTPK